jgi:hypothetical protein
MRKAYLFIYDNAVGNREEIKAALNQMSKIKTWRFDMPNCFYIISEDSASDIYEEFESINGARGKFLFIEASDNRQGQMLKDTWHFLRNKKNKPKDAD